MSPQLSHDLQLRDSELLAELWPCSNCHPECPVISGLNLLCRLQLLFFFFEVRLLKCSFKLQHPCCSHLQLIPSQKVLDKFVNGIIVMIHHSCAERDSLFLISGSSSRREGSSSRDFGKSSSGLSRKSGPFNYWVDLRKESIISSSDASSAGLTAMFM